MKVRPVTPMSLFDQFPLSSTSKEFVDVGRDARDTARISVLMTTLPGTRMRKRDVARLDALLRRFENELTRHDQLPIDSPDMVDRLRRVGEIATLRPAHRGVALFVGDNAHRAVTLPQPVLDRVVLDTHFDARDVVYARQQFGPFRLVILHEHSARVYESRTDDALIEVRDRFPIVAPPAIDLRTFERHVVVALAALDRIDPRPLVAVGHDGPLAHALSSCVAEYAGRVETALPNDPMPVLRRHARKHVQALRAARARAEIPEDDEVGVVSGSGAIQTAVDGAPYGTLILEQSFCDLPPRSIQIHGMHARRTRPIGVNAALARVLSAGGTALFVDDGALSHFGGAVYRPHGVRPCASGNVSPMLTTPPATTMPNPET